MDHAETLAATASDIRLEYQAVLSALPVEDRKEHIQEMIAKFGRGFLSGWGD